MTFHPIGAETSGSWFHDYDWLDFNSCQTGHAYYTYDIFEKLIAGDYNRQPLNRLSIWNLVTKIIR
jgi:hypothetical protein